MKKYVFVIFLIISFLLMFAETVLILSSKEDRIWQSLGLSGLVSDSFIFVKIGIFISMFISSFVYMYCVDTVAKLFFKKNETL